MIESFFLSEDDMLIKSVVKVIVFTLLSCLIISGCSKKKNLIKSEKKACSRIISTAPSITETLFELGFADEVVGVTNDVSFPKEATTKEKVGRVLDINVEKVLSLKPDTVMVIDANPKLAVKLNNLGLRVISFNHSTINGFLDSIPVITKACGEKKRIDGLVAKYKNVLKTHQTKDTGLRALFVVGRDYHSDLIKDVYIAGKDSFFSEIIKVTGMKNAYSGSLSYPKIQIEGVVSMNPDIIVDIVSTKEASDHEKTRLISQWKQLKDVNAVKKGNVFIVNKSYWSIPGPRFINIVSDLKKMIKKNDKTS